MGKRLANTVVEVWYIVLIMGDLMMGKELAISEYCGRHLVHHTDNAALRVV